MSDEMLGMPEMSDSLKSWVKEAYEQLIEEGWNGQHLEIKLEENIEGEGGATCYFTWDENAGTFVETADEEVNIVGAEEVLGKRRWFERLVVWSSRTPGWT